jgi:predicted GTPase
VVGTPVDLAALIDCGKPCVHALYTYADAGVPTLAALIERTFFARACGIRPCGS